MRQSVRAGGAPLSREGRLEWCGEWHLQGDTSKLCAAGALALGLGRLRWGGGVRNQASFVNISVLRGSSGRTGCHFELLLISTVSDLALLRCGFSAHCCDSGGPVACLNEH